MPPIRLLAIKLVLLLLTFSSNAQSSFDCLSIDPTGLSEKAFQSFENDLFAHYRFDNDSIKTYRTFLAEVASLSIDLKKLPSNNSIQLVRQFKKASTTKNSIWVKLSEYESDEASKNATNTAASNQKDALIFNYRGGLIQCLKNNSESEDFKEIISGLEENGNVSTSLIAQKIYYIIDGKFSNLEMKKFIAFDIYYSILMVIEKAFG